jgi:2-keto-4-pentenoate hydratase/2-oxohepta-3-ene-1,7-dioic acid hydratase in catechol pathway
LRRYQPCLSPQHSLTCAQILSPLTAAEVGTIRCIGLNYKDHAAEMKFELPKYPELFLKPGSAVTGPCDAIELPREAGTQIDAEVELAVVVGQTCKDVSREDALEYVLGYTVANDLTARDVQKRGSQWSYCKSFDGFCPLGPVLVSAKAMPDPSVLQVKTELNGRIMQQQLVSDMIFSIPEIIEYLSKVCATKFLWLSKTNFERGSTLTKGTVILTGTPAGIGASHDPPVFLKEGDELLVTISHGLGSLTNQFVAAK